MKSANRSLIIGATLAFLCGAAVWTIQREKAATLVLEQWLFEQGAAQLFPDYPLRSGAGSHAQPFQLSRLQAARDNELPFLVNTDDDPNREFDSHPLSASDLAVLLQSLKENGVSRVMLAATHAWNNPDPFALDALKSQCGGFSPCITSGVLGRGAVATAMPPAFVRASIPATAVKGNIRLWPQVNRVSIENTFFGEENTWAGFALIDSEENSTDKAFLVARWDDRIIFSAPLLALLAHENCRPDELVIESGKSIRFPGQGKVIAIDEYGRVALRSLPLPAPALFAWQLLRPEPAEREILKNGGSLVQILDQSKGFGEAHQSANQHTHQLLQNLYQSPRVGHTLVLRRLPGHIELLLLATLCLQLATLHGFARWARYAAMLLIAALLVLACYRGLTWIPCSPVLASIAASLFAFRKQSQGRSDVAPQAVLANPVVAESTTVEPIELAPVEPIELPPVEPIELAPVEPIELPPVKAPKVRPARATKVAKTSTKVDKKSANPGPASESIPAQKAAKKTPKNPTAPAKKRAKAVLAEPDISVSEPPLTEPAVEAAPPRKKIRKTTPVAKKKGKG